MLNKYEQKINKLKEDLIYAVNENYEGELEIEDVTDSSYSRILLGQDKKVIDGSNYFYSEAASKIIEVLEDYCNDLAEFDGRTLYRNSEIVDETLGDFCRITKILTLAIRKNNADWQARLDSHMNKEDDDSSKNELGTKLADLFRNMTLNFEGDEEDDKE